MCVRFSPLTEEEAQAVLGARNRQDTHAIRFIEYPDPIHDARPGPRVPVYVPDAAGNLAGAQP